MAGLVVLATAIPAYAATTDPCTQFTLRGSAPTNCGTVTTISSISPSKVYEDGTFVSSGTSHLTIKGKNLLIGDARTHNTEVIFGGSPVMHTDLNEDAPTKSNYTSGGVVTYSNDDANISLVGQGKGTELDVTTVPDVNTVGGGSCGTTHTCAATSTVAVAGVAGIDTKTLTYIPPKVSSAKFGSKAASSPTAGGNALTLTGKGLAKVSAVYFGETADSAAQGTSMTASAKSISVTTPPLVATGTVHIYLDSPTGAKQLQSPTIAYLGPNAAAKLSVKEGDEKPVASTTTTITVTDQSLSDITGVTVNGTAGSWSKTSDDAGVLTVPPGHGTAAPIVLTNAEGISTTLKATWKYDAPKLSALQNSSGAAMSKTATGTVNLKLTGSHLDQVTDVVVAPAATGGVSSASTVSNVQATADAVTFTLTQSGTGQETITVTDGVTGGVNPTPKTLTWN